MFTKVLPQMSSLYIKFLGFLTPNRIMTRNSMCEMFICKMYSLFLKFPRPTAVNAGKISVSVYPLYQIIYIYIIGKLHYFKLNVESIQRYSYSDRNPQYGYGLWSITEIFRSISLPSYCYLY